MQLLHRQASERIRFPSCECAATSPDAPATVRTVMRFSVSVPVLSEQMTLALPSVSTAGIRRTMLFFAAIRRTPTASTIVTTAGRPSGIAATARLIDSRNMSSGGVCSKRPMRKISAQMASAPAPSQRPVCARRFCSGVFGGSCDAIIPAMRPTSVRMPVAVTTPSPFPAVISEGENTMFFRSPSGVFSGSTTPASFAAGRLSPVSALSPALNPFDSISRRSAGAISPARSRTRSPGTSCAASTVSSRPLRMTRALGLLSFFRASMACSARLS